MEARFSAPVQTGPGAHPASCTVGTGSFPRVKSGQGMILSPPPILVLWSRMSRAIPLLPLWAVRPVQSLGACTRGHFAFLGRMPIEQDALFFFPRPSAVSAVSSILFQCSGYTGLFPCVMKLNTLFVAGLKMPGAQPPFPHVFALAVLRK
jgi:hypothetical protein